MSTQTVPDVSALLQAEADQFRNEFRKVRAEVGKVIVGQQRVVEATLVALFCGGNVLLEGVPGRSDSAPTNELRKWRERLSPFGMKVDAWAAREVLTKAWSSV